MEAGITLLSDVEAPGSGASANDAAAFLKKHTQATQVAYEPALAPSIAVLTTVAGLLLQ